MTGAREEPGWLARSRARRAGETRLAAESLALCALLLACAAPPRPSASEPPATNLTPATTADAAVPTPAPGDAAGSSAKPAASPAAATETAGTSSGAPAASASAEPSGPHGQTPIAMLTARDAAFLVNYSSSDARQTADTDCEKQSKGDLDLRRDCLDKARERFQPDVVRFKTESEGHFALMIYKRSGSALKELYTGSIEFFEEAADSVRMRLTGREKGLRPLFRTQKDALIRVPNNYSIELEDPQLGKLSYDEKIGLIQQ